MGTAERKVRLIATARQNYGGRAIAINQEFEVDTEQDAEDLVALRFAVRAPEYGTAALLAQDVQAGATHTKRTYRRRDMKAEH